MATARDICTRALKRLGIVAVGESMTAAEAADALADLNDMIASWQTLGVNTLASAFTLNDTVVFFVPPRILDTETDRTSTSDVLSYQGAWNASTNTPSLATATGTKGHVYKVSDAGSTVLDDLTSQAVDDYIVFNGTEWLKGQSSAKHIQGIIAMLAVRVAPDYGVAVPDVVARDAELGWRAILADYVRPPAATFDAMLTLTRSRRGW